MKTRYGLAAATAAAALMAGSQASALNITLIDNGFDGSANSAAARMAFAQAAHFWEQQFSDNITVVLRVGFNSTGFSSPNIIGQTSSAQFTGVLVNEVYAALAADRSSALDNIAVDNLTETRTANVVVPGNQVITTGVLDAITQQPKNANGTGILEPVKVNGIETVGNREFDNDGTRNNADLRVNSANLKALGFGDEIAPLYNGIDGTVTFNSAFNFDFTPQDGIGVGQIDFIGTAIHEIGHALGFVSGVDIWDNPNNANNNNLLMDAQSLQSVLDLFRYSDDVGNVAPGAGPVLDWSVGNAVNGRPYFMFDGVNRGLSGYGGDEGFFSTGASFGDVRQASHWQDTAYTPLPGDQGTGNPRCLAPVTPSRGIMDPTFAGCEEGMITSLDLAAFDAIGWDLRTDVLQNINTIYTSAGAAAWIPEPATWTTMIMGFGMLGSVLRRRRPARVKA